MNQDRAHPDIYQLRIVLRGISPLIWRRLLVRSDNTLAQLHTMLQIVFEWSNEYLHHFHVYGKDYGSNGADTRHVMLSAFGFHRGERFRYVYNYFAHWQCDLRLEAVLPYDSKRFYPVCTGGKRAAPPEDCAGTWAYLEQLDAHRYPPRCRRLLKSGGNGGSTDTGTISRGQGIVPFSGTQSPKTVSISC